MNTSHYPSLELCKKLTEIGFPDTGHSTYDGKKLCEPNMVMVRYALSDYDKLVRVRKEWEYVCPSIMEMLDVMPNIIDKGSEWFYLVISKNSACFERTLYADVFHLCEFYQKLPNALAEMILWLHENNYINFK